MTITTTPPRPGVCCPRCGTRRFRTAYTRHPRVGVTTRVRKCCGCGHRIRTREVIESASA